MTLHKSHTVTNKKLNNNEIIAPLRPFALLHMGFARSLAHIKFYSSFQRNADSHKWLSFLHVRLLDYMMLFLQYADMITFVFVTIIILPDFVITYIQIEL